MSEPTTTNRTAPLHLWRIASALITTLFNLFGAPEQLAAKHTITAKSRALILSWLRCAEALVRQLLVVEASAYERDAPPRRRLPPKRERRAVGFDADKPETWRISFRAIVAPAAKKKGGRARASRTNRLHSAWPLAERFEALLRVHNNPTPFAKRLARRLYAAPRLALTVFRAPVEYAHRVAETTFIELRDLCRQRCLMFDSA